MSNSKLPSNRSFGWVFTVFFGLVGAYSLWRGGTRYPWMFGLGALTAGVTLLCPGVLAPLNRVWMKLGEFMGRIVNPVVLGTIYYAVIVPVGVAMRMAGRDPMNRKRDPAAPTYWIDRKPPGPDPDSMPNQF